MSTVRYGMVEELEIRLDFENIQDFVDHNKSVFLRNNLFFLEILHFPSYNLVKKIHNFLQTLPQQKKL